MFNGPPPPISKTLSSSAQSSRPDTTAANQDNNRPLPGQHVPTHLTTEELSWILGAGGSAEAPPNSYPDPFSPRIASQSTSSRPLDPDFFEQELEQALAAEFDPTTLQQLDLQLQSPPSFGFDLSQAAYRNMLYPQVRTGNTYGMQGATSNLSPVIGTRSSFTTGQDAASSVYSDVSAYQRGSLHHPELFQSPSSPSFQGMDLPNDLDLSRYNLISAPAPSSAYAMSNISSVAPSSLSGHPGPSSQSVRTNPTSVASVRSEGPSREAQARSEVHDVERKHVCPHCHHAFGRAFNLKTHLATHDPQRPKPYKCPYTTCGRGFSRKHDLGRHMSSVHEKGENSAGSDKDSGDPGRVWCTLCRRTWAKGLKAACMCEDKDREMGRVKWEDCK